MVDIDRFCELLEEVCDELPDEMFKDLHQGIVVSEDVKISPYAKNDDLIILGEYRRAKYGNQITIYYGSFEKNFSYGDEEFIKNKLREVVRHEFRHHMENLSGIYGRESLEYEDAVEIQEYRNRNS